MRLFWFMSALSFILASCQSNVSTITGTVVGSDGQPMPLAHVHLGGATRSPGSLVLLNDPMMVTELVQKDGTFSISTSQRGPLVLLFTGVGYKQLRLPLPLERPTDLSVDIRLTLAAPDTSRSEILIYTTIDGGATHQRVYLAKQVDGSFRVDLPSTGDSVTYHFPVDSGPWGTSLIGATADRYELTSMNEYASIVSVTDGHAIIEYRMPPQSAVAAENVRFGDSTSTIAAFVTRQAIFVRHVAASDSELQNHLHDGKPISSFTYPWMAVADTISHLAELIADPLLKDEMALEVLECYVRARLPVHERRLLELVAKVPATSLAWVYHGSLPMATQLIPEMGDTYITSVIDHHPWRSYAAYLLFYQCAGAKREHDDSTVSAILSRLKRDFRDTPGSQAAQDMYAPREEIRIGAPLPEFAFPSLDDSTEVLTNATFHGHHLLVVFWGTHCSPCIAEMPVLHEMYAKYEKAGLKILSVALHNEPEKVSRFRKVRWPMPWSVTAVCGEQASDVSIRFAAGTPKHILVDPSGGILMIDSLLYGNDLDSTLAHLLTGHLQQDI